MNLPERLGKYPITDVLGKGAMGVVCEWLDAPTVQRVIRIVADELEDCRVVSSEVLEERIRELSTIV